MLFPEWQGKGIRIGGIKNLIAYYEKFHRRRTDVAHYVEQWGRDVDKPWMVGIQQLCLQVIPRDGEEIKRHPPLDYTEPFFLVVVVMAPALSKGCNSTDTQLPERCFVAVYEFLERT